MYNKQREKTYYMSFNNKMPLKKFDIYTGLEKCLCGRKAKLSATWESGVTVHKCGVC